MLAFMLIIEGEEASQNAQSTKTISVTSGTRLRVIMKVIVPRARQTVVASRNTAWKPRLYHMTKMVHGNRLCASVQHTLLALLARLARAAKLAHQDPQARLGQLDPQVPQVPQGVLQVLKVLKETLVLQVLKETKAKRERALRIWKMTSLQLSTIPSHCKSCATTQATLTPALKPTAIGTAHDAHLIRWIRHLGKTAMA